MTYSLSRLSPMTYDSSPFAVLHVTFVGCIDTGEATRIPFPAWKCNAL